MQLRGGIVAYCRAGTRGGKACGMSGGLELVERCVGYRRLGSRAVVLCASQDTGGPVEHVRKLALRSRTWMRDQCTVRHVCRLGQTCGRGGLHHRVQQIGVLVRDTKGQYRDGTARAAVLDGAGLCRCALSLPVPTPRPPSSKQATPKPGATMMPTFPSESADRPVFHLHPAPAPNTGPMSVPSHHQHPLVHG